MKAHTSHRLVALATVTVLAVGCAGTPGTSAIPGNKEGGGGQNRLTLTIVTGEGDPERIDGATCTWPLFRVLGIEPQLGRTFVDSDDWIAPNEESRP